MFANVGVAGHGAGRVGAAIVLVVAGLAVVTPSASATSETACDGTIGKTMVERVVIPAGANCRLRGTTVRQNVVVSPGARLVARGARLLGSVQGTDGPRSVRLLDTNVAGNIHLRETTGIILIGNSGCTLDPVAGNNIHLVENSGPIGLCQMRVVGNVHLIDNSDTVFARENRVGNNLHARGNTGRFLRLRENRVGTHGSGNMDVRRNRTAVRLRLNRVSNQLTCRGNARMAGFGNRAGSEMRGQCANLR